VPWWFFPPLAGKSDGDVIMAAKRSLTIYRRLLQYSRPYALRIVIAVIASLMVAGTDVTSVKLIQPLVDKIIAVGNVSLLKWVPIVIVGLAAIKGVARYLQEYLIKTAGQLVVQDIRNDIYSHSLQLSMGYFSRHASGNLISRILNDVGIMQRSSADILVAGIRESFTLLGLIGLAFYNDWKLAGIAFLVLPVAIVPATIIGRKIKNNTRRGQEAMGSLTSVLQESLSGIKVVKSFGMEKFESQRFSQENYSFYRFMRKVIKYDSLATPIIELLGSFGVAMVFWYGLHRVFSGAITQGELFSFMAAIMMTYTPLKRLTKVANLIQRSVGAAERVFEIIDEEPEIAELPDAVTLQRAQGKVRFEHVTFAYEKLPVLQDFSFTVSPGELVALVGPSGVGKSTIISLLSRFYDPQSGSIMIDGIDIRHLTLKSLAENIALVDQDTFLFHDSIKNNICYGSPGSDAEAVVTAAHQAYADEFIDQLPKKYETSIGDRGVRLSGGQRQRICIARAILKNAPILVLDEATSALDTESEAIVQKALANLMKNRTTLVIAHRLSTIQHADKIIVLENGRVFETGGHDELLNKGGLYSRLYEMQFKTE